MKFCPNCGKELIDAAAFCSRCGNTVPEAAPKVVSAPDVSVLKDEQEFLDTTHKLLRWEKTSWKVVGIVFLVIIILYALLFMVAMDNGILATLILLPIFLPLAIVPLKAAGRIDYYLDTLYTDAKPSFDRCGSIGMIVFCYFFNTIALIFFLINFIRIKSSKKKTEDIVNRQKEYYREQKSRWMNE